MTSNPCFVFLSAGAYVMPLRRIHKAVLMEEQRPTDCCTTYEARALF